MSLFEASLVITELFAFCALLANILAYRQHSVRAYRILSGLAMLLLAIHFIRLEAYAAGIGCSLAVLRNLVSLRFNDWFTTSLFVACNILALCVEWFYFQHGPELFIAYSASIIFTVGTLKLKNTVDMKRWFTLAEALNLWYAVWVGSVFGAIYCSFNLIVLSAFWIKRYRTR